VTDHLYITEELVCIAPGRKLNVLLQIPAGRNLIEVFNENMKINVDYKEITQAKTCT